MLPLYKKENEYNGETTVSFSIKPADMGVDTSIEVTPTEFVTEGKHPKYGNWYMYKLKYHTEEGDQEVIMFPKDPVKTGFNANMGKRLRINKLKREGAKYPHYTYEIVDGTTAPVETTTETPVVIVTTKSTIELNEKEKQVVDALIGSESKDSRDAWIGTFESQGFKKERAIEIYDQRGDI